MGLKALDMRKFQLLFRPRGGWWSVGGGVLTSALIDSENGSLSSLI